MNINSGNSYVYNVNIVKPRHIGSQTDTTSAGNTSESAGCSPRRLLAGYALSQLWQSYQASQTPVVQQPEPHERPDPA